MNDMNQRQSLEQQRAAAAWQAVLSDNIGNIGKEFKSVATSLPADIQSNGLGQTLAFLEAKGKNEHKAALNAITDWIKRRLEIQDSNFMEWLMTKATTEQYRQATVEAVHFAIWLKRFAEAELPKEGD